ncbi:MAG: acyl-CoA dehydratase activase-related protein [Tannerella sp.]|jgi:predicted CoA-substrate-specific enzyme activase|nr:acyl-CoA dehydratase activase-related protein [Tannerella sp.]
MERENEGLRIGIDAGSTTLKVVVLDAAGEIVYKSYRRHQANIRQVFEEELRLVGQRFPGSEFAARITGSAGIGIAERTGIPFVQEVVASVELVRKRFPQVRTLIVLGGEDAKIVLFTGNGHPDIRMNGSCAGGTGAFIDQMASLLNIPVEAFGRAAAGHTKIYPVASRCGVFAKTDIQNLISCHIPVSDIAASTFHAVAMQSITTLAHGCDIVPPVLFTGGPLSYLPALREAFCKELHLNDTPSDLNDWLLPENSACFPAWGAALQTRPPAKMVTIEELLRAVQAAPVRLEKGLPALFESQAAYEEWQRRRAVKKVRFEPLGSPKRLSCFLGIDSGSTTTKMVITDDRQHVVYHYYSDNEGHSLKKVTEGLAAFYRQAKERGVAINLLSSAVTGYGEDLIRSALNLDYGIVETVAHLTGAQFVDPQVSFVLDIGGQDMKSIFIHQGVISNIELNEACSSGCGSFLQNFAATMHLTLPEFSRRACLARHPSDLGSRCTVFMNSKVKQSLRDGAQIDDIAAGLAYSAVRNCLFKVLKISGLQALGSHIVVQGGTFRNDAVYRALELLSGKSVGATDCPELMGAFGAALYARSRWEKTGKATSFAGENALTAVREVRTSELQCKGCTNSCSVVKFRFGNGNVCYAGNKCQKIFGSSSTAETRGFHAFEEKNRLLFRYTPRKSAVRIGIPRVLNLFENFPFWQALFTACGYEVVLSPGSTFDLYRKGAGSVMSDNICFPAKLVHGHILWLAGQKVDRLFYPLVPKERKEFEQASDSYNCPVVSGYPDVIRSSMDPESKFGIPFDTPVIGFNGNEVLRKTCRLYFASLGVEGQTFESAFRTALNVWADTKRQLIDGQKAVLKKALRENRTVFVVAGRPYHADPFIHQKTGQILSDLGVDVLTDDVFREEAENGYRQLSIVSQWAYPDRVIQTALQVAGLPRNVQMIQLNSFGCGPDSFFMDEAGAILKKAGKHLTVIRIDEIASPGAIRLRLRSLVESLRSRPTEMLPPPPCPSHSASFTKHDRKKTILVPWFADFLSPFIPVLGKLSGYHVVNLPPSDRLSAETGLKYGHNEVCYPSTLVLGDILKALQSGAYDLSNVAVAITQTGGQCRATNYISQIKNGLVQAGFPAVPVIAIAVGQTFQNKQEGFRLPWLRLMNKGIHAVLYGDALRQMFGATVIREKRQGEAKQLFDRYMECGCEALENKPAGHLFRLLRQAVAGFNAVPAVRQSFTKIGVIGEIFVKYNSFAQAHISEWLRERKMEVVMPSVMDFIMQYFVNAQVNTEHGIKKSSPAEQLLRPAFWGLMNKHIQKAEAVMKEFRFYQPYESIFVKARYASDILHLSNQFGEGWTIAAEVAGYARQGIRKVVCLQPFGCIANHVVAKGIETRLKKFYPEMELLYLDVDAGIADVHLQNRLHFMVEQ